MNDQYDKRTTCCLCWRVNMHGDWDEDMVIDPKTEIRFGYCPQCSQKVMEEISALLYKGPTGPGKKNGL